ncbi:MAG: serine/threonine protein phosphatase, partial [Clostridiales bacterium]|jgi:serine/threonine protein phosphatase 1|nr:serine/threonine protein phosphatase [Clostridiales bacterium]
LAKEITDKSIAEFNENFLFGLQFYLGDGGQTTISEFTALPKDERDSVVDYLEEFRLFAEVSCDGKDYVLVHAGLENFQPGKNLADYDLHELIFAKTDYGKTYFEDKYLVTGHTPTRLIVPGSDRIHKAHNHIAIDCGCALGGKLGVICLNDGREFYV